MIPKENIKSLRFGLLILVIILGLGVFSKFQSNKSDINLVNPFLKEVSNDKYQKIIDKNLKNDSAYFIGTFEEYAIRELLIFKKFPTDLELLTDFQINLQPKKGGVVVDDVKSLNLKIVNNAVKLNYKGETYGIFKIALPLINIEKIEVTEETNKTNKGKWETIIENPFKKIDIPKQQTELNTKNPYHFLFLKVLGFYKIPYLPYNLNTAINAPSESLRIIEQHFLDNDLTYFYFKKLDYFMNLINLRDKTLANKFVFKGEDKIKGEELIRKFLGGKITLESAFDLNKLAAYQTIRHVFKHACNEEVYFVLNNKTNLIEPFFGMSNCFGKRGITLKEPKLNNSNYLISYAKALQEFAEKDIYNAFIRKDIIFKNEIARINQNNPYNIFNYDILKINQSLIKKSLDLSGAILSELVSMDKDKMVVSIFNPSEFPIKIKGLMHKSNQIKLLDSIIQIESGKTKTVTIDLPSSFGNLFVRKKSKVVGFRLDKDIYDLSISLSTLGLDETYVASMLPYIQNVPVRDDLFRQKRYLNGHNRLKVDEAKKQITFLGDSVSISSPLIIPKGYLFVLEPGKKIDIIDGGLIVSYSPLSFLGNKLKPIKVYSSDKKGQGILVLSEGLKSNLKYVDFDNLKNPKHGNWEVSGAITFYESPVRLENISIKNNRCEDAINIFRTNFTMSQVEISNTQSDAFDGDFVTGTISNSSFINLGNDAIDVSGSNLIIKNVVITNAGDKGLSAGEDSKMIVDNVEIVDSEIAIAGKDLSVVDAKNLKIVNTKLGFTAFQKKPEFGPSKITVNGISMSGIETKYLIERSSSLYVDNKKIETTQNVKDRMYGVEFGISSDETRNIK